MIRLSHCVVGALALIATACSDNGNFAPFNSAAVRLVNDTDTPIVLVNASILDPTTVRLELRPGIRLLVRRSIKHARTHRHERRDR